MQWWCSAQGIPWTWTWRPYLGVWLLVLLTAAMYWRLYRRPGRELAGRKLRIAAACGGILLLWAALDWPLGTLAAGYLESVHMLQFLLLVMAASPLLLAGVPAAAWDRLAQRRKTLAVLRPITHPLVAAVVFNLIILVTHLPKSVDALMYSQLGSFGLDLAWLAGGLIFWWPLLAPVPARPRFVPPLQIGYLFVSTISHTGVAMWLLLAEFPVYRLYELAPPLHWLRPVDDQQLAGGLMLLIGGPVILAAILTIFMRWYRAEEAESAAAVAARRRAAV